MTGVFKHKNMSYVNSEPNINANVLQKNTQGTNNDIIIKD